MRPMSSFNGSDSLVRQKTTISEQLHLEMLQRSTITKRAKK